MPLLAFAIVQSRALLTQIVTHSWYRACCHILGHIVALLLGTVFVDERVAFSKAQLTKNDSYRDRLLEPEIADLVDLCEALRLSIAQRQSVFRCFGHVDFMRRATISRRELLRYCNLRETPCSVFLLRDNADGEMTHRTRAHRRAAQRWDIMQFIALCFSICTAEPALLVAATVQRACDNLNEGTEIEILREDSSRQDVQAADTSSSTDPTSMDRNELCIQIDQCLAFFPGVASTAERGLQLLLEKLYSGSTEEPNGTDIDFRRAHGVSSIQDAVVLFPVLVYPCLWLQRVLKARILGANTWKQLANRRRELQSVGMTEVFLPFPQIITASKVHLRLKMRRQEKHWWQNRSLRLKAEQSIERDEGSAHLLTPRKIVPSLNSVTGTSEKQKTDAFHSTWEGLSTISDAWRVTANHALASVCLTCLIESDPNDKQVDVDEAQLFRQTTQQIKAAQLSPSLCQAVWKRIVRDYGYQFANFLFENSSLKEINPSTKTIREEKRTLQRYEKAQGGAQVPEDKPIYWKELLDPLLKCAFYYNIRTGESRWERPANFIGKPKRVKRRKKKDEPKAL